MARRPIAEKQAARMRKAVTRKPLPAFIDLVPWLKERGYAQTNGGARDIILAGRVKSESHTVGIAEELRPQPDGSVKNEKVVARVPIAMRSTLRVEAAK